LSYKNNKFNAKIPVFAAQSKQGTEVLTFAEGDILPAPSEALTLA
jgi:hypothetical protein